MTIMTMVVEKHIEIPRIYDLDRMLNEYQTPQRHFIDRSCIAMCKVVVVVVVMVTCKLWVALVHCPVLDSRLLRVTAILPVPGS